LEVILEEGMVVESENRMAFGSNLVAKVSLPVMDDEVLMTTNQWCEPEVEVGTVSEETLNIMEREVLIMELTLSAPSDASKESSEVPLSRYRAIPDVFMFVVIGLRSESVNCPRLSMVTLTLSRVSVPVFDTALKPHTGIAVELSCILWFDATRATGFAGVTVASDTVLMNEIPISTISMTLATTKLFLSKGARAPLSSLLIQITFSGVQAL
jgi:hypothetical protein